MDPLGRHAQWACDSPAPHAPRIGLLRHRGHVVRTSPVAHMQIHPGDNLA
jgi:hypothetical protein